MHQFTPVTLDERERYQHFLDQCPQKCSDYSFANLFGWAEEYGLEWCFDPNLVWIRQQRPTPACWAPIGAWEDVDWRGLRDTLPALPFWRVPGALIRIWQKHFQDQITVTSTPGQWDYVYSVQELIALKGNRFHKKKNLLRQFHRNYQAVYHALDMECVERVLEMQNNWCSWKECVESEALEAENAVISRVLQNWDRIPGMMGGALEVDGLIVAYTVAEALTEDSVLIHFEKGHTGYKGVYQAINNMFLANAAASFTHVNREQDLDDPGLRKAKLSYNPVSFLEKSCVSFSG